MDTNDSITASFRDRLYGVIAMVPGNEVPVEYLPEGNDRPAVMFEQPLIGIASADDEIFARLKEPGVVGPWHKTPAEWLDGAESVVSLFFPFTEIVRRSNVSNTGEISPAWLYGRIEGQAYLVSVIRVIAESMTMAGRKVAVPSLAEGFHSIKAGKGISGYGEMDGHSYGSNWSERHVAYICGLGTFGLSKGLITEKGIAGRFMSLITDLKLMPDPRPYTGIYDYCTMCGACVRRCPVQAISIEHGKDHALCDAFLDETKRRYAPRYGFGFCQTGVPCESANPSVSA